MTGELLELNDQTAKFPSWMLSRPKPPGQGLSVPGAPPKPPAQKPKPDRDQDEQDISSAYEDWKRSPTKLTAGKMLGVLGPTVEQGLMQFGNTTPGKDPVLHGRAKLLALQALETYDPKQSAIRTHVINHLQGLRRVGRQQSQAIRVPERVTLDYGRIQEASGNLEDRLGREATDEELSDETGLSVARILRVRRQPMAVSSGQFEAVQAGEAQSPPAVESQGRDQLTWQSLYEELTPTDRKILEWTLGWNDQPRLSGQQIAAKLGLTPGAISQRKSLIQSRYNDLLTNLWSA